MNASAEVTPKWIPKDDFSKMIRNTKQDNASDDIESMISVIIVFSSSWISDDWYSFILMKFIRHSHDRK